MDWEHPQPALPLLRLWNATPHERRVVEDAREILERYGYDGTAGKLAEILNERPMLGE